MWDVWLFTVHSNRDEAQQWGVGAWGLDLKPFAVVSRCTGRSTTGKEGRTGCLGTLFSTFGEHCGIPLNGTCVPVCNTLAYSYPVDKLSPTAV